MMIPLVVSRMCYVMWMKSDFALNEPTMRIVDVDLVICSSYRRSLRVNSYERVLNVDCAFCSQGRLITRSILAKGECIHHDRFFRKISRFHLELYDSCSHGVFFIDYDNSTRFDLDDLGVEMFGHTFIKICDSDVGVHYD